MHLIFLTGLPRSGTTLLAEFISLHSEVHFNTNHGGTSIMEYVPDGAIPYGGSAGCLSPMCVAYVKKRHVDFARHNVSKYVSTNHSTIANQVSSVLMLYYLQRMRCVRDTYRVTLQSIYGDTDIRMVWRISRKHNGT